MIKAKRKTACGELLQKSLFFSLVGAHCCANSDGLIRKLGTLFYYSFSLPYGCPAHHISSRSWWEGIPFAEHTGKVLQMAAELAPGRCPPCPPAHQSQCPIPGQRARKMLFSFCPNELDSHYLPPNRYLCQNNLKNTNHYSFILRSLN